MEPSVVAVPMPRTGRRSTSMERVGSIGAAEYRSRCCESRGATCTYRPSTRTGECFHAGKFVGTRMCRVVRGWAYVSIHTTRPSAPSRQATAPELLPT